MKLEHAKLIVEELVEFEGIEATVRENWDARVEVCTDAQPPLSVLATRKMSSVPRLASVSDSVAPTSALTAWAWVKWSTSCVSAEKA